MAVKIPQLALHVSWMGGGLIGYKSWFHRYPKTISMPLYSHGLTGQPGKIPVGAESLCYAITNTWRLRRWSGT